jgi:hypothetical protein
MIIENKIEITGFVIARSNHNIDNIWIQRTSGEREGEGTEVQESTFVEAIDKLFEEWM